MRRSSLALIRKNTLASTPSTSRPAHQHDQPSDMSTLVTPTPRTRQYIWLPQATAVTIEMLEKHLDTKPVFAIRTTQAHRCTICDFNLDSHYMVYRLMECTSSACAAAGGCSAWMKTLTCVETELSSVFQHGAHPDVDQSSPNRMTREMKRFTKTNASNGAKPMRILAEMIVKLRLTVNSVPSLGQVQRVAYYHKKKTLLETALVAQMAETARSLWYRVEIDQATPFTFACPTDPYGIPVVGNGSNDRPFLIGVTTKRMIRGLVHAAAFPLHIDATYKVNQQAYPMVVCGVSDAGRSIHVGAVFISSHLRQEQFAIIFASLFAVYQLVTGRALEIKFVAGDADDAQYNGFEQVVVAACPDARYLMCFFHVMLNVKKRVRSMAELERRLVYKHVYRIHHARDEAATATAIAVAKEAWQFSAGLKKFATYFAKEWIASRFHRWKCYENPTGHAKTNNPLEQFNKAFKRDYTQRQVLPINGLMEKLKLLCTTKSTALEEFKLEHVMTPDLPRRLKYLNRAGLISHTRVQRASLDWMLCGVSEESIVLVKQHGIDKKGFPLTKADDARRHALYVEVFGQAQEGWRVDVRAKMCPCGWWFKFGCCVHLVEAMKIVGVTMDGDREARLEVFVSRRIRKRVRDADEGVDPESVRVNSGGRPAEIGPASL